MPLHVGLIQKQQQALTLTPSLRQSISILQFSSAELNEYILDQIQSNPALQLEVTPSPDRESSWSTVSAAADRYDRIVSEESLTEHLEHQISLLSISPDVRAALYYLIGSLDDKGYLTLDSLHAATALRTNIDKLNEAIAILHTLAPPGIGARDLRECLLLQIRKSNSLAYKIVDKHLGLLAEKEYELLSTIFGVKSPDIYEAELQIKTLHPYPAMNFNTKPTHYISADVILRQTDCGISIIVNQAHLPAVQLDSSFSTMLHTDSSNEVKRYAKDSMYKANQLIRGLEQRQQTLYNITKEILAFQSDFFKEGTTSLKSMTLKDIASAAHVHESTVSRATSNKYLQTPLGVFAFKQLFSKGVSGTSTDAYHSVYKIKKEIKELIDNERKTSPLSDQKIVTLLQKHSIAISRRTVAKYRTELGIQDSRNRIKK
ncbi:RNA polymerase factor sigma-54 [Terribacillus saccharophilus]|jgi:RNA polymerase sigma-54 factor|uniref:RNA polymerase sigma-54 factor n=1 Tax=Terribacillus saccharophilus TaxID=361277 RepID=A0ABX4GWI9_9BACI|nr:RNA polymerase factor sigma-54 [Terribacillus saccharophilus]PAD35107.1 RNA polymerase sigma-54 factor [Terribacillus saccharophilus]PAD95658.1 RNA polymerase sigma-54 factor [Terribacillus saccharophilus]PAD99228.1 RNA polymerase sigma-54 factor [Terribacillus saccharophilus]